jgi:hypothetical protein
MKHKENAACPICRGSSELQEDPVLLDQLGVNGFDQMYEGLVENFFNEIRERYQQEYLEEELSDCAVCEKPIPSQRETCESCARLLEESAEMSSGQSQQNENVLNPLGENEAFNPNEPHNVREFIEPIENNTEVRRQRRRGPKTIIERFISEAFADNDANEQDNCSNQ